MSTSRIVSLKDATTDSLAYTKDAQHAVETLARELESLAGQLRAMSTDLANEDIPAVERAAYIVNSYVQQAGQGGSRLQAIVSTAAKIDRARAEENQS